ncbi:glycerophosphodiester phosphodiesterase [Clostridium tyrobutyricum]|jgi:glycerophosphoryl diester phosphodiesterase|uniref:glycerophosphodiester phosphodiesterase n=1 Tax=Clostridium tyrobutyricum TaxID=1519 RepID=UPI0010AA2A51|nr:glycerophosphodiester phosphodiesterase family protein [Clostridium tyrobutyricum]MBV4428284.1 glycerophosphodiester phosphodiesterase [Clostridium tyrobutyricum]MBV4436686.1 glycerophosphodiester phosphodiesterase [Clostridium tyrobutyricum]MBV4443274.1 glycerophosphodiester phosphodiesterase [Clostridium tyrobutyricum]MBV4448104.1 glycerophosphodiester phosphodiesterase [Clostridium tyrobutyricum]MCH4200312.1 glycerophosphodiester phosphodiesterase [Clostridium tyrobutyricum]
MISSIANPILRCNNNNKNTLKSLYNTTIKVSTISKNPKTINLKYTSAKPIYTSINLNFNKPVIIAHRAASGAAPENSIPAIDEASKIGYWGVELDVCSSSDGVLYLLHDGTLDRTTNSHGPISSKTSKEIDKLVINKGPNISNYPNLKLPRFEDALLECKKYNLIPVFDIKFLSNKTRDLNTMLRIIKKHNYSHKLLIHSFNYKDLEYLRKRDKGLILMPMVNPNKELYGYRYIKSFKSTELDCNIDYLNKNLIHKAHKDGLKVFCWTIDNPEELKRALNLGVDFIYSDKFNPNDINAYYRPKTIR